MDDNAFKLSADLIDKVNADEMTPDEAEAEARRLGLEPLVPAPPADRFDPMTVESWTLPMAIAWVAWRTPDAVREWWDRYREASTEWRAGPRRSGPDGSRRDTHTHEQRRPPCVPTLRLALLGSDTRVSGDSAIARLRVGLGRGVIQSTGINDATHERTTISPELWPSLTLTHERGRDAVHDLAAFPYRLLYTDILIRASDVRRTFPPVEEVPAALPGLMRPDRPGHMPLFCAAQWIVTQGGDVDVGWQPEAWKTAYAELLKHIVAGEVELIGTRDGRREQVEPHQLSWCPVVYPFEDHFERELAGGDDLVLFSPAYVGDEAWLGGPGDSLRNQNGPHWSKLLVRNEDVARLWPFTLVANTADAG